MLPDFFIPLATIAVAEIGDKTQIAMMALAARYRHALQIFMGAIVASVFVDGSAVVAGAFVAEHIPKGAVLAVSGILFIIFGIFTLAKKEDERKVRPAGRKSVFIMAFSLFFVSEFGDKSQVAALLFGANYNMLLAFLGTISGIAIILAAMLLLGRFISRHLNEKALRIFSSLLFIAVGVATLVKLI